jgi:uncharacterized protein YbaA (DUF1428 family)
MLTTLNLIPVARNQVASLLASEHAAGAIYREYGGLGGEILMSSNLEPTYGCAAFPTTLALQEDELVLVVLDRFRDRAHYEQVMEKVDADPRIGEIFAGFTALVDLRRVVRGAFEEV